MKVFLCCAFLLLVCALAKAQFPFIDTIPNASTYDVNKAYVTKETSKQFKKSALVFIQGYYLANNMKKVQCDFHVFKRKNKPQLFLFALAQYKGERRALTANDIQGYWNGNAFFQSVRKTHQHMPMAFFIKQLEKGRMELYERPRIPNDPRFLYYLKIEGETNYFVLDPFAQNIKIEEYSVGLGQDPRVPNFLFTSQRLPEKFLAFTVKYFTGCQSVINKVRSQYYTIEDLPKMVHEYNIWWKSK